MAFVKDETVCHATPFVTSFFPRLPRTQNFNHFINSQSSIFMTVWIASKQLLEVVAAADVEGSVMLLRLRKGAAALATAATVASKAVDAAAAALKMAQSKAAKAAKMTTPTTLADGKTSANVKEHGSEGEKEALVSATDAATAAAAAVTNAEAWQVGSQSRSLLSKLCFHSNRLCRFNHARFCQALLAFAAKHSLLYSFLSSFLHSCLTRRLCSMH
jgi:hypothetical protein